MDSVGQNTADPAEDEPDTNIWVHVCGAVSVPGVYELPFGSRIYEAIEAAGGMAEGAAADYLNMAGTLSDGDKVAVPFLSELSQEEQYGGDTAENGGEPGASNDGLIDINHAEKELLMTLPGIGEAKAEALIAYREAHGAFERPEDIMQVSGIKEAAYERLKDKITVR
nr:helix-hairpin-helix domain-containing protein [Lientehia hominis]